ncbi:MAG TPA: ATP-binding protein [Kofleriaceae bacterium]|nr:ATP-binding protein [Kofleriaceae bacterium]
MLKGIHFENFKSYVRADLPLAELTVLLGPNASGKSNALEALQILTWLASGQKLDALVAPYQADLAIRGVASDFSRAGQDVSLGCQVVDEHRRILTLETRLRVGEDGLRVVGESLSRDDESVPLYQLAKPASAFSNQVLISYNNFARGHQKPEIPAVDQQAIFTQLTTPARFQAKHDRSQREIPAAASLIQTTLERVLFLDPAPAKMRDYSFRIDHKKLRGDGSNISAVIAQLERQGRKADLLGFVKSLPEQDIVDLSLVEGPRGEVMLELHESFGGQHHAISARLLSDGTLRVLAIAAALLSVPEGSLVVIEEIDNGVHPPRALSLLQNIRAISKDRSLRVLLTTHNPALLDAIPDDAIPDVVACYREPSDGTSRLARLSDLEQYSDIVSQGPLGQIVTRGVLDRLLKRPRTVEAKQQDLDRLLGLLGRSS